MTVGTKVKQACASLESAKADFEQFALETQDKAAKQMYGQAAQQTQQILENVRSRVTQLEEEEPEYKGY